MYYKSLYNKQINYIFELLDRQVQIVGLAVDDINNSFSSDLNQINFSEDLTMFFQNKENQRMATEKMKLFFSKYENLVTGMKYYDNKKNEFTLKKDSEESRAWLEQSFILHVQEEIFPMEKLVEENRKFNYYLPVIDKNETIGNIVVTVDFQKYFKEIFTTFNLQDYQWQWVLNESGISIYENSGKKIEYSQIDKIKEKLSDGYVGNIVHNAVIDGKTTQIISSYYSTQLLQKGFGLVFSAPTAFFQKYIIRNSLLIVIGTLILIQLIVYVFWKYFRSQKEEMQRLKNSESMLFKLIEEMPVGVIIHNRNREIVKANKVAAGLYSYKSENEMQGKIYPERSILDDKGYLAQNESDVLNPDQFITIRKEIGEIVLFRKSIPVTFMGEESMMEILIDVTLLESARKNEVKANVAKSEFLARMSYEIRTPLNGIIGMTDILTKQNLEPAVMDIVRLLRRSTEVLLNIINDILDFSKIESGKMILDEAPFNLREEIGYCIDLARTNISKEVKLTSIVEDNVPESIIGDAFRLRQILINLLNNSVKNTGSGEIILRCYLKSNDEGILTLAFELNDTGTLFDKPALKKIFGDYLNMESARNNEETAFGTILSKQLIELMGGEIHAESPSSISKDSGTKVEFTINSYSNDRIPKKISMEQLTSYDKIKTLVITRTQNRDEEVFSMLHKLGLSVTVTTFMKMTVNQIKAGLQSPGQKYSLIIIMDDKDFNGFEVVKSIWENNLAKYFIMIMISSNEKKGNYMKCVTMGIDSYLIKPITATDLDGAIRNNFPFIDETSSSDLPYNVPNNINILIVEDNKMNQKVIGTMLKNLGHEFDIAEDGYAGYLQARSKKYDLIFMDLVMPEMDGFESAKRIIGNDKSALIVAFTADNLPETRRKAELSGIKDFISKPVRIDDLRNLMTKHFRN
jgi:signal transduction histidine kinase/CheY-like chemotaxis protein